MIANTAVVERGTERAAAMVRSGTSLYIYWHLKNRAVPIAVRVLDLSGRPRPELLDGTGARLVLVAVGQTGLYLDDLQPGHLYAADVGELVPLGFSPLLSLAPVQTPWSATEDWSAFPSPYHRS